MANLANQVLIVTGASSGIGAALAQAFSQEGAHVALVDRRLKQLNEFSRGYSVDVLAVTADITKDVDREAVIQQILDRWGRIDILVNNAGLGCMDIL
jgi:NADP-dependent 3-hydroxy acid dehydrogenase YdfG